MSPNPNPSRICRPVTPSLRERAIGLIEDAREEREEKFAKNARSLVFQLGVRARNAEPDEAELLKQLEEDVVDNRVPIVADVRDLPEDLGQLFETPTSRRRRSRAATSATSPASATPTCPDSKEPPRKPPTRNSSNGCWPRRNGRATSTPGSGCSRPSRRSSGREARAVLDSGFAGRWEIQTDNLTQWVADANGVVTINDGQWKGKTATWKILADGTLEVHWPDKPKPYTFTRDGDGWTGKTSFGKPASLTPGDW